MDDDTKKTLEDTAERWDGRAWHHHNMHGPHHEAAAATFELCAGTLRHILANGPPRPSDDPADLKVV